MITEPDDNNNPERPPELRSTGNGYVYSWVNREGVLVETLVWDTPDEAWDQMVEMRATGRPWS